MVSDSTKVISRPIEQELLSLVNQNYDLVTSIAFGLSYESDRKYYLFVPESSTDTYPTQAHVYNIFTNTWVRHTLDATCGFVDSSNNFYLGNATTNHLYKERKTYSFLDYADYGFSTTISSSSNNVITITDGIDNVSEGDILYQASDLFAQVDSVDLLNQTITVVSDPGLTLSTTSVLKGINVRIKWVPVTLGNPSVQKQFNTVSLLFKSDFIGRATLGFSTDLNPGEEFVPLQGRGLGLWGLFPWGEETWGGQAITRPVTQWIPRSKQRASNLSVSYGFNWAFSGWVLEGLAVFGEFGSEKVGRE